MKYEVDHNKLIKKVARKLLLPASIIQKGTSRTFLYDGGWYTIMIEFQPGWNKGSYLNIGSNLHFYPFDHLVFSYGSRVKNLEIFEDEVSFSKTIEEFCELTLNKVQNIKHEFRTVQAALNFIGEEQNWNIYTLYDKIILNIFLLNERAALEEYHKILEHPMNPDWKIDVLQEADTVLKWFYDKSTIKEKLIDRIYMVRSMKKLQVLSLSYDSTRFQIE